MEKKKHLFLGTVVSKKMDKTATVVVLRTFKHKKVGKILTSKKKFYVHDPLSESSVGDVIEFFEGKPVSKIKYMYFFKVVKKALSDSVNLSLNQKE